MAARLRAVAGDEDMIAAVVGDEVGDDAALGRQQEVVHTMSHGEVANVVGDHAIEPAHAVFAGQHQLGLPAHVEEAAALQQRAKLRSGVAERGRSISPAIASRRAAADANFSCSVITVIQNL